MGAEAVSVIAFDTHAFVKRLTGAGMPEAQAEVLADEQRRVIDDRLVTKDDLERVKTEINAETKITVAEIKADILRWMIGTMGFQTIVILGAVLALSRFGR
jgi:2-phosphoglycerate kinase